MKTFLTFTLVAQLLLGSLAFSGKEETEDEVVFQATENVVVLKTSRKLKGADVEVLATNGYVVSSQKILYRKLVIDFAKIMPGRYTVRLHKGNINREFSFEKKNK